MNGKTAIRCAILALLCVFVYAEEVGQVNLSSIPREGGQVNLSRCRHYFEHVSSFFRIVLTVVLCHAGFAQNCGKSQETGGSHQ